MFTELSTNVRSGRDFINTVRPINETTPIETEGSK
jgi:hypothetical protein